MFYKQTSQYSRCRPTIVDRCPTVVDKGFVTKRQWTLHLYLRKYFHTYDRMETLRTTTSHLMPCMRDAACTGHVNADIGY